MGESETLLFGKFLESGKRREKDFLAVKNSLSAGTEAEKSRFLTGEHHGRSIAGS